MAKKRKAVMQKRKASAPRKSDMQLGGKPARLASMSRDEVVKLAQEAGLDNTVKTHNGKTSAEMVSDLLISLGVIGAPASVVAPISPPSPPPRCAPPIEHHSEAWHWIRRADTGLFIVALWAPSSPNGDFGHCWRLPGLASPMTAEAAANAKWVYDGVIKR